MTFTSTEAPLVDVRVIIPYELSLVVTPRPLPPLDRLLPAEDCIKVCATRNIKNGTVLYPNKGPVRNDKLPEFPTLSKYDMRSMHGALDTIDTDNNRICNWVRFIKCLPCYTPDVNVLSFGAHITESGFMVIKDILYGQQLTACLMPANYNVDLKLLKESLEFTMRHADMFKNVNAYDIETPLDLSQQTGRRLDRFKKRSFYSDDSDLYSHSDSSRSPSPESSELGPPSKLQAINPYSRLDAVNLSRNSPPSSFSPRYTLPNTQTVLGSPNSCVKSSLSPLKSLSQKRREKSMLPCSTCGKSFDRPSLLKRHTRTHTGEKPHVCDVCQKGFSTSSSLNTHRRIHSGEKPHQCQTCGKKFTASSNLYYHKMTHVKEKPHKCHLCTRSFPTPGDLRCHMYVHNGMWPYKCSVCDKGFSKVTNLRNHKLLHESKIINVNDQQPKLIALVS